MSLSNADCGPLRRRALEGLREPASATALAGRLGESRQSVNCHVRELERAGLVELVEERRRRGCTERVMRARARVVVVDPDDGQDNQTIELVEEGPRTRVICVRPGSLEGAGWDDLYEDVREGWITFFHQLRHSVERHPDEDRRTVYLTGQAVPADVVDALGRELSGPIWHAGRFQHVVAAAGESDLLAAVHAKLPIDSNEVGDVSLTVTTYGLDEGAFEALRQRWESWWAGLTRDVAA